MQSQDYLFVREFVAFIASVLLKCCKQEDSSDMEIILGGVASISDEISWFKNEATVWGVDLASVSPLKANLEYHRFVLSVRSKSSHTVAWAWLKIYNRQCPCCQVSPELYWARD